MQIITEIPLAALGKDPFRNRSVRLSPRRLARNIIPENYLLGLKNQKVMNIMFKHPHVRREMMKKRLAELAERGTV